MGVGHGGELQGYQTIAQRGDEVHPLPRYGGAEDQDDGEREPEGRTASVSQSPNSGRCPRWVRRCWVIKKPWRTSAALVVITYLHIGQPHGPSVPRPVADFDGLVRHLVCGIHHSQDDHAIGEGEADEYMPG